MDYPKSVPGVGLVDGKFVDEDQVNGTPGSLIPAGWGNAVTDELLNILARSGVVPDETQVNQLAQAIFDSPTFGAAAKGTTPAQFDASTKLATMEAVQRALGSCGGFRDVAAGGALTASDVGKYITYSTDAPANFTLPDPATLPAGARFYFEAVGAAAASTFSAAGKTFAGPNNPGVSSASFIVPGMTACEFIAIGNSYRVVGGSGKASIAATGYKKSTGGLILQWGLSSVAANNVLTNVSLPIAWPNGYLQSFTSWAGSAPPSGSSGSAVGTAPLTQIALFNSCTSAQNVRWSAIGY